MPREKELALTRINPYYMILLSCLLCTILMLNSNYVNEQRAKERLNQERKDFFDQVISLRKLEPQTQAQKDSDEVCSRGSDDLIEYYKTGELSLIELDEGPIQSENKDEGYMKALRDLVNNLVGGEDDNNEHLRNLEEKSDTDLIIEYGKSRILAMVVFLAIGILSIFGWIGCCVSCCCDCCCCCCFKKSSCKIPCFAFTLVFYALVIAVSIYGLTQSNKIFTGLADTECSLLKFIDQILDGETKQDLPRWAGINGIKNILTCLKDEITGMGTGTYNDLVDLINNINTKKGQFSGQMQTVGDIFFDSGNPAQYKIAYLTNSFDVDLFQGKFVLDLVKNFGKYENNKYTDDSILSLWYTEYNAIASEADGYMNDTKNSFNDVLNNNLGTVTSALDEADSALQSLRDPFDTVNDKIASKLADYSESIDKYGKLAVKLVFSILMVMNVALAAFMILISLFSMKACVDCCFCRCIFKSAVHILWNILALMMVLSFIVGSLLALVGRVGGDVMSLASFIFSEDNFNDENPLFLNKVGEEGTNYLRRCFLGDGNIAEELNITDQIISFNILTDIEDNITAVYNNFSNLIFACPVYNNTKNRLLKRKNLTESEIYFSKVNIDSVQVYDIDTALNKLNEAINEEYSSNKDIWSKAGNNEVCPNGQPSGKQDLSLLKCNPFNSYSDVPNNQKTKKYAEVVSESLKLIEYANDKTKTKEATSNSPSLINVLDELVEHYIDYLKGYTGVLEFLLEKIGSIINVIRPYTQRGESFSFLNGQFIRRNLKIMLKYLEKSLGKDLYTVGVCLILAGCSLILSISSTILLDVIINLELKQNMNPGTVGPVPSAQGPEVVISPYQVNDVNVAAANVQY